MYDVITEQGENVVVPLTRCTQAAAFRGAVAWSERLRGVGVPLPRLLIPTQREIGQVFNRDTAFAGSDEQARRLITIVDELLDD